jgi:hypothetical protein
MSPTDPVAVESLSPEDGPVDRESTGVELTAWALRRRLPSELRHKVALRWPGEVSELILIPEDTLKTLRERGDAPRLFGFGRALFTTMPDLLAWVEAHEIAPGQLLRTAVIPRGAKLPPPVGRGQKRGVAV